MKHKVIVYDQPVNEVVQKHSKVVFGYPKEKIWNQNGVSLDKRIAADSSIADRIKAALEPSNLDKYIVKDDDSAPTRCIDGRIRAGWEHDPSMQNRPLGPKIAGGTAHAALAYRIVDTERLAEHLLFETDIRYVVKLFKELGLGSGGHIDDLQSSANTGCGAVDNINLILDRLQRPAHQQQLRGLSRMILGDAYDGKYIINEVIGRMLYLDALKPSYMPKENDDPEGEFIYKKTVVKTLRDEANASQEVVPALTGEHNEVGLVLNFVYGTTFDNDRFSYDNNNEIQLFGWDVWHMYEEARRLYEYNMLSPVDNQLRAVNNRMKYVTARTLLGIATTMVLTDGSLKLIAVNKVSSK